ncbi:MAG: molybdopterin oxidoreductase family protein, partial [Hyphomicrobiales bacterium]|nr:molybdopterin oxidoreductase family protein [Hyphomicrobiales bacterium]
TPREHIDWMLKKSGRGSLAELEAAKWLDCQPEFRKAHFLDGFAYPDGKFRFKPDWTSVAYKNAGLMGPWRDMPKLPDHWAVLEDTDDEHPFRLATSPARNFLNTTFNNTPTSLDKEIRPTLMVHPDDAAELDVTEGDEVIVGNRRGEVRLNVRLFDGVCRGVVIAESIWPNAAHRGGRGINMLTGSDPAAPYGGAAFHDNRVWIRKAV